MIKEWLEHPVTEQYLKRLLDYRDEFEADSKNPYVAGNPFETFGIAAEFKGALGMLDWVISIVEEGDFNEQVRDNPDGE